MTHTTIQNPQYRHQHTPSRISTGVSPGAYVIPRFPGVSSCVVDGKELRNASRALQPSIRGCNGRIRRFNTPNTKNLQLGTTLKHYYEGWNFNSGNYLFTTDTK